MSYGFLQDARYAARGLVRQPVFAAAAVLTLALGIGATSLVFSLIDGVLLRALPFPEPDRLVQVWETFERGETDENVVSPANLVDWRENTTAFQGLAARINQPVTLVHEDGPREIRVDFVSPEYFDVLGVGPLLGGVFPPSASEPGPIEHVVISHALWLNEFGGDPEIVGKSAPIGSPDGLEVVGVMPRGFGMPGVHADIWLPFVATQDRVNAGRFLEVVGRLAPGYTLEQAQAQISAVAAALEVEHPTYNEGFGVRLVPLQRQIVGDVRPSLILLFVSVGFLLLLACANIANLLLGRAATRTREFAVRLSLGASRGRVARQLLTESLLLGVLGGALALALVVVGHRLMLPQLAGALGMPRLGEVGIDARVLGFTAVVTLAITALFGLAPALAAGEARPAAALREAAVGSLSRRRARLRAGLIVGQVALATVLLVGAALLGRSLWELQRTDLGFHPEQVVTMRFSLVGGSFPDSERRNQAMDEIYERVRALPGVVAVGSVNWLPLAGQHSRTSFGVETDPVERPSRPSADIAIIEGDYFAAMGIPLLGGRAFGPEDHADAGWTYVIDDAMARRHFDPGAALGQRLNFWWGPDSQWGPVVGVVGSIRHHGVGEEPHPTAYFHNRQVHTPSYNLVTRAVGGPPNLAELVRAEVQAVAPTRPIADIRTMDQVVAESVARPRATTFLIAALAGLALLLAAIGLYGVVSYSAAQRAREIGIRVALGASRGSVLRLVLGQGVLLTALGLALGLAGAAAVQRLIAGMLYGVRAFDPLTIAAVVTFLFTISLVASWLPGHRATKVDPMVAMRSD
jgi:putative ABC transport system permease protein